MERLKFQRAYFRNRGLYVPFEEAVPIRKKEEEHRAQILGKLRNTLYKSWQVFSLEHFDNVPVDANTEDMLPDFLSAYVAMLWEFKRVRKQGKSVQKYAISIRINAYDKVFQVWKRIAKLWDGRYLEPVDFEDGLINTSLDLGQVMRELTLIGNSQMNSSEYLIQRELHQLKAVSIRHSENHALRNEVYLWADENIKPGMALDSAASELAGKVVPLKWRTVRDHLTEWKKLRSTGTP